MRWSIRSWQPWLVGGVVVPLAVLGVLVVAGADPLPTKVGACEPDDPLGCVQDGPMAATGTAVTAAVWLVGLVAVVIAAARWRRRARARVLATEEQAALDAYRAAFPNRVQVQVRIARDLRLGVSSGELLVEPGEQPQIGDLDAAELNLEVIAAGPPPPRFDLRQRLLPEPTWPPSTRLVIRAGTPMRWYGHPFQRATPAADPDGVSPYDRWAIAVREDTTLWIAGDLRQDRAGFRGVDHVIDPADGVLRVDHQPIECAHKPGWNPPDMRRWDWPVGLYFPFLGPWLSAAAVLLAAPAWAASPLVGLPLTTLLWLYVRHLLGRMPEDVSRRENPR